MSSAIIAIESTYSAVVKVAPFGIAAFVIYHKVVLLCFGGKFRYIILHFSIQPLCLEFKIYDLAKIKFGILVLGSTAEYSSVYVGMGKTVSICF